MSCVTKVHGPSFSFEKLGTRYSKRAAAAKLVWMADFTDDGALTLTASNAGEIHSVISTISVATEGMDPSLQKLAQCVLAGGMREWVFQDERLEKAARISVEVETESGKLHEEIVPKGE